MSKTLLIIQREFLTRVKKKSFILLTILSPFIMVALVAVPIWLASIEDDEQDSIAISDTTGRYISLFKDDATYRFVPVSDPENSAYYSDTTHYEAVISITGDLVQNPKAAVIYSSKEVPVKLLNYAENVLNEQIRTDKLKATGIEGIEKIIEDAQNEISIPTVKRNAEGDESSSSTAIAMGAGWIMTFLIYMFVMSYGGMVMSSVMEEKTNRIVELMVSSVKPFQLMMGKIIGIALVGFTQLFIWGIMLSVLMTGLGLFIGSSAEMQQMAMTSQANMANPAMDSMANAEMAEIISTIANLPLAEMLIMFVLYFVGGYLLYASFFAGVGAAVNEAEDSSQFMMPVIFVMIFGMYAAMGSIENTNGPLAFWTSLFPLTSPIVMMVRIPYGVPLWQELLSLALLFATSVGFVWVSSRIYRVGILMYGKKPSIKEMIKWIRYK